MIMTEKMNIEIENIESILEDEDLTAEEKLKLINETVKAIRA
jgi:hypothetical protein